jgi:hypothetical protein
MNRQFLHQGDLVVSVVLLRQYLATTTADSGRALMDDAFLAREVGAQAILNLLLCTRGNPSTRRNLSRVATEWRRLRRAADDGRPPAPAVWYRTLVTHAFGLLRQLRAFGFPRRPPPAERPLTERLVRSVRRQLGYTGAVQVELPTLQTRASEAARDLMAALAGQQLVLWVDNWYLERYRTNPARPVASQDVTAMGVLLLSSTADTPAQATRSHRLRDFPGHLALLSLTIRVTGVADEVVAALSQLLDKVRDLGNTALQAGWIRVPLDIHRPNRRSLQWRALALTLSENRVSANRELLEVLVDIRGFQAHSTLDAPLLVDEKVHYAISRLLYAQPFSGYDVARWLRRVPLLYGVWHPYKQTLALVYRTFFPVFALLEFTGCPALGSPVRMQRKVLYMEKVCAALLLAGHSLRAEVDRAIAAAPAGVPRFSPFHF